MDQIYTVTTDNGANMLKTVKLLSLCNKDSDEAILKENKGVNDNNDDNDEDIDLEYLDLQLDPDKLRDESDESNEHEPEEEMYHHTENILQIIEDSIPYSDFSSSILTGVRCAAHTLQLVVDDALKNTTKGISLLIKKARRLVKKLRTSTFLYMLKKQNLKKPIIDCPTRWCSTVIMLERLLLLKDYCTELAVTKFEKFETLTDAEWAKIEEVCQILQPIKTCTEKLQAEQLTLGDFFGHWLQTKLAMKKMNTSFAMLIFDFMVSREKYLLENDVLLSALFLDPRFKIFLEDVQIEKAKTHLKHLWAKMMSLEDLPALNPNSQEFSSSESESTSDDLESLLKLKEIHHNSSISQSSPSVQSTQSNEHLSLRRIELLLESYHQEQKRISRNTNILEFWQEKSTIDPELYKLARVTLAVPATQVSVERLFSGLKFILSPLRTNVNEEILEDQLLVRANRIFNKKDD
ncbi:PREDICTED: zinc finger BED domain-containing protein 4-like, partial [Cyphomyrmex costatus]